MPRPPRPHPPPRGTPPPFPRPGQIPPGIVGQSVADTFGGALNATMDTLKTLIMDAGSGAGGPTKSVAFRGSQTAGQIQSLPLAWACDLVQILTSVPDLVVARSPRSYTSLVAGWHSDEIIYFSHFTSTIPWRGRSHFDIGQFVYIDSSGGMGTSDIVLFTFELT